MKSGFTCQRSWAVRADGWALSGPQSVHRRNAAVGTLGALLPRIVLTDRAGYSSVPTQWSAARQDRTYRPPVRSGLESVSVRELAFQFSCILTHSARNVKNENRTLSFSTGYPSRVASKYPATHYFLNIASLSQRRLAAKHGLTEQMFIRCDIDFRLRRRNVPRIYNRWKRQTLSLLRGACCLSRTRRPNG
jgi:hypothetical protein